MSEQSSSSEKRIYVIVAETVQAPAVMDDAKYSGVGNSRTPWVNPVVKQPIGRIAAQVGHVVSKMWSRYSDTTKADIDVRWEPTTTIVLSVKNSAELAHIRHVLGLAKVWCETFEDTNEAYGYGPDHEVNGVWTALATRPIDPALRIGLLDHLPLWGGDCK